MNAFSQGRCVEFAGMQAMGPLLKNIAFERQIVITARGPQSRFVQEVLGDAFLNVQSFDYMISVEIKVEESDKHGNLFIENWSNKCNGERRNKGWAHKLKCDFLMYYFLEQDRLIISHWPSFYAWLAEKMADGRSRGVTWYKERTQGKRTQMNMTTGRIVPIRDVLRYVPSVETCAIGVGTLERARVAKFLCSQSTNNLLH